MKKLWLCSILALIFAVGVNIQGASATLFLSGDCNIILEGIHKDEGNKKFFQNILQDGTRVVVLDNLSWKTNVWASDEFGKTINEFYDGLDKVTSTLITGDVTPDKLYLANLFVSPLPDDRFTSNEISTLKDFLARGGSVFFLGENQFPEDPDLTGFYNDNINAILVALGSRMSIVMDGMTFDDGYTIDKIQQYWTAAGSQIAKDPFTIGVTSLTYVSPSQVSGGNQLFFGRGGQPFVSYEVVPVPASAWLLGSGLLGLGFFRRRGRK